MGERLKELPHHRLTRRDFLKIGFLISAGAVTIIELNRKPEEPAIKNLVLPEFDPFPPGFDMQAQYLTCNIIVHPGFCRLHPSFIVEHGVYGEYDQYLNTLRHFIQYTERVKDGLTIFVV